MAKSTTLARPKKRGESSGSEARAKKISITVDRQVLQGVERDARREGKTLSAHITQALARDLRQRRLAAILDRYEAENGVISDKELSAARAKWRV